MTDSTLGIDLSTIATRRAMVLLQWKAQRASISEIAVGHPVGWLARRAAKASWTAIDSPFGWPDHFIQTITDWAAHRGWPREEDRKPLRYRATDIAVSETKLPLSVSSDRIASTAMLCAQLLDEISEARKLNRPLDRTGSDRVFECYPGAAMKVWAPEVRSFKGKTEEAVDVRLRFLDRVAGPRGWLLLSPDERGALGDNEDLFDALICSLIARAASKGPSFTTTPLPDELREQAQREGWIHVPAPDTLEALATP